MTHEETIRATGNENVTAEHASTLEVTSDDFLTPAGDCIVGIEADRTPEDFGDSFVRACQDEMATITVTLKTEGHEAVIEAQGHPDLTFDGDRSVVVRTSDYVDDRTVAVDADAAATDLDRDLVATLADGTDLRMTLSVE